MPSSTSTSNCSTSQEHDLLGWVIGQLDVPADQDTPLFRRLRDFHMKAGG